MSTVNTHEFIEHVLRRYDTAENAMAPWDGEEGRHMFCSDTDSVISDVAHAIGAQPSDRADVERMLNAMTGSGQWMSKEDQKPDDEPEPDDEPDLEALAEEHQLSREEDSASPLHNRSEIAWAADSINAFCALVDNSPETLDGNNAGMVRSLFERLAKVASYRDRPYFALSKDGGTTPAPADSVTRFWTEVAAEAKRHPYVAQCTVRGSLDDEKDPLRLRIEPKTIPMFCLSIALEPRRHTPGHGVYLSPDATIATHNVYGRRYRVTRRPRSESALIDANDWTAMVQNGWQVPEDWLRSFRPYGAFVS